MTLFRKLRTHLSFANVTSLMALFIALSGVAWAASLPKNSVGAAQIKKDGVSRSEIKKNAVSNDELKDGSVNATEIGDGTVGGAELGVNAVSGAKIADGTVALADLAPNSVDGSKVVDGSLGRGDVAAGTFLLGRVVTRRVDAALPAGPDATTPGADVDVFAKCAEGETLIGGGANVASPDASDLRISRPSINDQGEGGVPGVDPNLTSGAWKATARQRNNNPAGGGTLRSYALCAAPQG